MNLNLKNPLIAALILVIMVLSFVSLRQCEKAKEIVTDHNDTEFLQEIAVLKKDTSDLRAQLSQKAIETTQDSTNAAKSIWLKGWYIARLKRSNEAKRVDVQPILDSIPKLQAFVESQDSVIFQQSAVIGDLKAAYQAQVKGLNEQLELNAQIQAKSDEIAAAYEVRVKGLEDKLRKSERKRKFWRTTTTILTGGVAVLLLAK